MITFSANQLTRFHIIGLAHEQILTQVLKLRGIIGAEHPRRHIIKCFIGIILVYHGEHTIPTLYRKIRGYTGISRSSLRGYSICLNRRNSVIPLDIIESIVDSLKSRSVIVCNVMSSMSYLIPHRLHSKNRWSSRVYRHLFE